MHSIQVRIPFNTKRSKSALGKVIGNAAEKAGVLPHQVALLMTHFLNEIGEQLAAGECVEIPGFGVFGPWTWMAKDGSGRVVVLPRFQASIAFKQTVATRCLPSKVVNKQLDRYKKNHATPLNGAKNKRRLDTAMETMRKHFHSQAREWGIACGLNED